MHPIGTEKNFFLLIYNYHVFCGPPLVSFLPPSALYNAWFVHYPLFLYVQYIQKSTLPCFFWLLHVCNHNSQFKKIHVWCLCQWVYSAIVLFYLKLSVWDMTIFEYNFIRHWNHSVCLSVLCSVRPSVRLVSHNWKTCKKAKWIEMLFSVWSHLGTRIRY